SVPSVSCIGFRMWMSCCEYSSLHEESSKTSRSRLTRTRAASSAPPAISRGCARFLAVRAPQVSSVGLWKDERPLLADARVRPVRVVVAVPVVGVVDEQLESRLAGDVDV